MDLSSITPLILTCNEERNLPRVLAKLSWAKAVVLIDSGSTDRTLDIAAEQAHVSVMHRDFDDHVSQWNFGLGQVTTRWVLSLDADYVLSNELIEEISRLQEEEGYHGYEASFRYCVNGRALRASLYPPRIVLFRRDRGRYVADGHTQVLRLDGACARLRNLIDHDDRKPLQSWLHAQDRYSRLERDKLLAAIPAELPFVDRLRLRAWIAPLITPAYCLFVKGLIRDGRGGLLYTLQRTYAEMLLALRLLDYRMTEAVARNEHADQPNRAPSKAGEDFGTFGAKGSKQGS